MLLDFKRKIDNLIDDVLNEREKRVILMYFGFREDKIYRQDEIAEILNLNRSTVSKIISKALKKIKQEILFNHDLIENIKSFGYVNDEFEVGNGNRKRISKVSYSKKLY